VSLEGVLKGVRGELQEGNAAKKLFVHPLLPAKVGLDLGTLSLGLQAMERVVIR
jgi:hypothetical protein